MINTSFSDERVRPKEAARFLGIAPQSLAIDRCTGRLGSIPYYKIGRQVFYSRADLSTWLESRRVAPAKAA